MTKKIVKEIKAEPKAKGNLEIKVWRDSFRWGGSISNGIKSVVTDGASEKEVREKLEKALK